MKAKYFNFDSVKLEKNKYCDNSYSVEYKDCPFRIILDKNSSRWIIDRNSHSNPVLYALDSILFDSPEDCKNVAIKLMLEHKEYTKKLPIDESAAKNLAYLYSSLEKNKSDASSAFFTLNRQLSDLKTALHKLGLDNYFKEDLSEVEPEKSINDILKFKLSGNKYEFFSESTLYKLVGKDDARTLLALIRNLIRQINPDKATEL